MDVSVIIINFNTFALTCDCIRSVYDRTKEIEHEIILVDNASSECDPNEFLKIFPDLILIVNPHNEGFGRANNQGMRIASGKYFLLLNSDTHLLNNAIDIAFAYAESNKDNYSVFGADIRNEDLSAQKSFYLYKRPSVINTFVRSFFFENLVFHKVYSLFKRAVAPDSINGKIGGLYGSYVFLSRIVYEDVGGFDTDFFMYCEDTEWFRNRIIKKYNVDICQEAKIVHLGGKSSGDDPVKKENVLSYYLYWYKMGYVHYVIYVLFSYLNTLPNLSILPFMGTSERRRHRRYIRYKFLCLRKVFFDIPGFPNRYNSRTRPLSFQT